MPSVRTGSWLLLLFSCILIVQSGRAEVIDSTASSTIAPGVVHTVYVKDGPFRLQVLTVDLSAKNIHLESFRPVGLVRTSEQARRNDREGHRVLAAINADFFSYKTGWPVNIQIANGEFVIGVLTERSHLILDSHERPHIARTDFEGWIRSAQGMTLAISGVNEPHRRGAVVLHTSYSDTAIASRDSGLIVSLKRIEPSWSVCDTLHMIVGGDDQVDLARIGPERAALWISNASQKSVFDRTRPGDTLLVFLGLRPVMRGARTALGGVGMILSNGIQVDDTINVQERTGFPFLTARHPRTFVGFDRDTTKLFLCVVDGRQTSSIGMNFREMADFLRSIGVWNAVNFDGGGSTTMVVRGKIVNSPSDLTGERPVANTLQVVESPPVE